MSSGAPHTYYRPHCDELKIAGYGVRGTYPTLRGLGPWPCVDYLAVGHLGPSTWSLPLLVRGVGTPLLGRASETDPGARPTRILSLSMRNLQGPNRGQPAPT